MPSGSEEIGSSLCGPSPPLLQPSCGSRVRSSAFPAETPRSTGSGWGGLHLPASRGWRTGVSAPGPGLKGAPCTAPSSVHTSTASSLSMFLEFAWESTFLCITDLWKKQYIGFKIQPVGKMNIFHPNNNFLWLAECAQGSGEAGVPSLLSDLLGSLEAVSQVRRGSPEREQSCEQVAGLVPPHPHPCSLPAFRLRFR